MATQLLNAKPFRILSLDGGGSWAIMQVMCLQNLYGEDAKGHDILRDFDMVVANSGGSITLAAMAENMTLSEVVNLFTTNTLRAIFEATTGLEAVGDALLHLAGTGPKYYTPAKLEAFKKLLPNAGGKLLTELPAYIKKPELQLMIMGFDYDRLREDFFRSNKKSLGNTTQLVAQLKKDESKTGIVEGTFDDITLAEAVHASSNAPLNFFDKPAQFGLNNKAQPVRRFWDGAVGGYNNPVLAGITEALTNNVPAASIHALSIGTGGVLLPIVFDPDKITGAKNNKLVKVPQPSCFTTDLKLMAQSILDDPPDAATYIGFTIVKAAMPDTPLSRIPVVRMNPLIQPVWRNERWQLPEGFNYENGLNDFDTLVNLAMDVTDQRLLDLLKYLADQWLKDNVTNQPIRADEHFKAVLGFDKFSEARKFWEELSEPSDIA